MKTCSKCKAPKLIDDFYADKRRSDGLRSQCKACHNEGSRSWQRKNRERDLKNKRDYMKEVRLQMTDEEHEIKRQANRKWYHNNPDWYTAKNNRRRALKKGVAIDPKNTQEYIFVLRRDPCSYCGSASEAVDHIDALHAGGSDSWDNLTSACTKCNSRKSTQNLLFHLLKS